MSSASRDLPVKKDMKMYPGQCGGNHFHRDIKEEQREMKKRELLRTAMVVEIFLIKI